MNTAMPPKNAPQLEVRTASGSDWDAAVDRAPLATVYHRDAWLGAIEAATEAPIHRLVCEIDGRPVCVWPIGLLRKGPIRIGGSPLPGWNTAYLGPVFTERAGDPADVLKHMIGHSPVRNPSFMALRMMDTAIDLTPLGFRETRAFETCEMDLTLGQEALWSGMKSTCRTRVRKGGKNGLSVREETDAAYIDDFWKMACDVFAKSNQRPPYSRRLLEEIDARLRPAGELIVTSAFHRDRRVATLIIPHDARTAMYFAGGTHADALPLAPNNLLHWETMLLCMERGIRTYDFISNRGSPGKFKRTFGPGERVSCRHWERAGNRLVVALRDRYERRARGRRRLPASGGEA
ncbi:MAG: GNAT family N-acetyltransferase [Planctomycetota bacterium]